MKAQVGDSAMSMEQRSKRNAELRARLEQMKKDSNGKLAGVMAKMMGIMGQNPEDLLTEAEIQKLLISTFKKFDRDGSGLLEEPEFHKAWADLGLKGSKEEISRAYKDVDRDNSGKIDQREFCN